MFRRLFIPLIIYSIGLVAGVGVLYEKVLLLWLAVPFVALIFLPRMIGSTSLKSIAVFALIFVTGFSSIQLKYQPGQTFEETLSVIGCIEKISSGYQNRTEIILRSVVLITSKSETQRCTKLALECRSKAFENCTLGDKIMISNLQVRSLVLNLGSPKRDRFWISRGIMHKADMTSTSRVEIITGRSPAFWQYVHQLRGRLLSHLDSISTIDLRAGSLIKAMILGDKTGLTSETKKQFSRTGVAHMLAVSGLHVGIIYLLLSSFLKFVTPLQQKRSISVIILLGVWLYVGMAGMGPSACRAAFMLSMYEILRLFRVRTFSIQVLLATAIIHLIIDPLILFQPGAQLSYLAVAGILLFMPLLQSRKTISKVVKRLKQWLILPVAAQMFILPVILIWFGEFPLLFLAGNLLVAPLMLALFYLGIVIVIFSSFGLPCSKAGGLTNLLSNGIEWLSGIISEQEWAVWMPDRFDFWDISLWYSIVILVYIGLKNKSVKSFLWLFYIIFFYAFIRLINHLYL